MIGLPLNFQKWIDEHRALLKPPVGNKVVWPDGDFIVMAVGGPNSRTDFHCNQGPEFFYQIEGQLMLKIYEDGKIRNIAIGPGEIFLLPPNVPHSPQRMKGSIGLVIEHKRRDSEMDSLQWYCEQCYAKLYEENFKLTNIETQFPAVFERYYSSSHVQCKACGHTNGRIWSLEL